MICPKCKKTISEGSLKCNQCGARIGSLCKKCGAYNSIYNLKCQNCKTELLKICPVCKSINFPNALNCRKCQNPLEKKAEKIAPEKEQITSNAPTTQQTKDETIEIGVKKEAESNLNYNVEHHSQHMAKDLAIKGLMSEEKRVVSLNGTKGIGKTIVLKSILHELKEQPITWLLGECSAITQLSPCGLIQDILLTFFNITNFCADNLKLKKESQRFFQSEFPILTNEEIFNLLNLLYPTNKDYYEGILQNKQKTLALLEKVFKTIIQNQRTVIVVENFDMIDGFSYEFLSYLFNSEFSSKNLKFLLTYNETRPSRGYLFGEKFSQDCYLDISLSNFDKNQIQAFLSQTLPADILSSEIKEQIYTVTNGSPACLEQITSLISDIQEQKQAVVIPTSFNNILRERLKHLSENPLAKKILCAASIQGQKFYPAVISQQFNVSEEDFMNSLNLLQKKNYIIPVNDFAYTFKNSLLWSGIFELIKEEENFTSLNESLFSTYLNYVLSSNAIRAIIAQNLGQDMAALNIWTDNIKIASYIGDANLYVVSQKQSLHLVDKINGDNASFVKNNICERVGKLLSLMNPSEAIEYLKTAVVSLRGGDNPVKEIELTAYLVNCCINLGDYYGTIECVDNAIEKLDYSFELEIAMLKSKKLDALLNIGNCGEIINLADNEILPVFEKYLNAKPHKNISINQLYKAWLQSYLALANALVFQGNNRAFEVISTLFELFEKNSFDNQLFICKTKLALAFANTIKGDIEASEKILGEIIRVYKTDIMDNESISRWNLINILNNFIHKKYTGIQEELFQVATFANNINDHFTKNILKTLLGKLFKDEENAKRAMEIYSDQITYFAKEKNAIGALLTWYLIAEASLTTDGPEKSLEVSQKALDVAQGPKINSYLFSAMYNKVIAEAHMAQAEYEFAKVHIEKAILIARKFELLNLLSDLYLLYGKYLQDLALLKTEAQVDYVQGAYKMYRKAIMIAQGIKNNYLIARIEKSKTVLNSFCQLNGIVIKEA